MIRTMSMSLMMSGARVGEKADERVALPLDEEGFRAFYELTSRPLWAYLLRMSGAADIAEEIFQEAYYRFCRAGSVYESESHRRNALFHIATNLLRDQVRRKRGVIQTELDDEMPARSVDRVAHRLDLKRALQTLEPKQREMIWLAYAQGASHAEIAEICGVKQKSVRVILHRARKKLMALLAPDAEART